MKNKTATFIGHRDCFGISLDLVKSSIERLLEQGVTDFLNGGMGSFDWLCARAVYELKISSHPEIRNYLVIPYLSFSIREKKYFDDILYPEGFEKYHFKSAISSAPMVKSWQMCSQFPIRWMDSTTYCSESRIVPHRRTK